MSAVLHDNDGNGAASGGDLVVLGFDRDVDGGSLSPAAIRLLAAGDTLGSGLAVGARGGSEVGLTLGAGAALSLYETYRLGAGTNRSPGAIALDPGAIRGADGTPGRANRFVPVLLEGKARVRYQPEQHRGAFSPFRGQMHAHTTYSDGQGLPGDAYDMARGFGLDWFVVTDHMEFFPLQPWMWPSKRQTAESRTIDGTFVALWGYEWGHGLRNPLVPEMYNHINILTDKMMDLLATTALTGLYAELALCPDDPIGKFNHPNIGSKGILKFNDWEDYRYYPDADRYMRLVRVMKGSFEDADGYLPLLEHGWHVAPGFGEDNHSADWGHSTKRMTVYATALTRDAIRDAMRARRTFTSSDRDAWVRVVADDPAGELWMGSTVCGPGPVTLRIECGDPTDGIDKVEVITAGAAVATSVVLAGVTSFSTDWVADPTDDAYYYVRVTETDGDLVWSAPIFVDR